MTLYTCAFRRGAFVLFAGAISAVSSCKFQQDSEANLAGSKQPASQSSVVDQCDLKTMEAKSSKASQANFQCAYDSLAAAGKLAGGGSADIVAFVQGLKEFKETLTLSYEVSKEISAYLKGDNAGSLEKTKDAAQKIGEDTKKNLEKDQRNPDGTVIRSGSRSALYQCFDQNITNIRTFYEIYNTVATFNDPSKVGSGQIRSVISLATKVANNAQGIFTAVGRCSESIGGSRRLDINRALSAWSKMMQPLATIKTVANCGVAIGEGGYIIAQNSACLVGDIKQYYEAKRELDESVERYENKIDKSPVEAKGCASKLGMHLNSVSSIEYTTRSGLCADRCLNPSTRSSYIAKYSKSLKIFEESQIESCSKLLSVSVTQNQIAECVSFCCDTQGTCVDSARRTAKDRSYSDAY